MLSFTHAIPGLILKSHRFERPLDYANPSTKISVFAREVIAPGKEHADLPCLVFFQGGPGSGSPRPGGTSGVCYYSSRSRDELEFPLGH